MIEVLLEGGANIHHKNNTDHTALDVARRPDVVQALKNADFALSRQNTRVTSVDYTDSRWTAVEESSSGKQSGNII